MPLNLFFSLAAPNAVPEPAGLVRPGLGLLPASIVVRRRRNRSD